MAENGREIQEQPKTTELPDDHPLNFATYDYGDSDESPFDGSQVDKETRLRNLKEKQNEERQKKLEEIKAQALAAQRFKEQKEQERRKRLEELRVKDDIRRQQVEERKRAITEAERDRLEAILRRNQEREARIEAKKRNERSSIVFAFGSSTPRMLDPTDMTVSFWGQRRAASTQNITSVAAAAVASMPPLTRRQSERDLDGGSKKRATSAGGLERSGESLPTKRSRRPLRYISGSTPTTPAGCASGYLGRRRTDLVPTLPSRDGPPLSAPRKSLTHSPGRAYSMTRLDQLARPRRRADLPALSEGAGSGATSARPLSSPRPASVTRSMGHLAGRSRPLGEANSRSMRQLSGDVQGGVQPRPNRATQLRQQKLLASATCSEASSRPSSSLSQQSTTSVASSLGGVRHRPSTTPRRPRPASIAVTGVSHEKPPPDGKTELRPPLPRQRQRHSVAAKLIAPKVKSPVEAVAKPVDDGAKADVAANTAEGGNKQETLVKPVESGPKPADVVSHKVEPDTKPVTAGASQVAEAELIQLSNDDGVKPAEERLPVVQSELQKQEKPEDAKPEIVQDKEIKKLVKEPSPGPEKLEGPIKEEKKPEPIQPEVKSETGPEPKKLPIQNVVTEFILAESEANIDNKENDAMITSEMTTSMTKPRITTEEEAKAALAEKRRLAREEAERQAELERQRIEAEHQAELEKQRKEEEEIRQLVEMQRQAEQERLQEAIKEAQKREEEEKLKREEEQRLKALKEEAERKAREENERQKAELQERLKNEEKEREARRKRVEAIMLRTRGKNNSNLPSQQNSEDKNENKSENKKVDDDNKVNDENKVNENKMNGTKQENGTTDNTTNGKSMEIVDNIIPDETVKNANTGDITRTDSINSNNAWQQPAQQYDSLI